MFGEANVLACTLDMVMAGTETTAATLQWAVFLMVKHPHVQGESHPTVENTEGLGMGLLPYSTTLSGLGRVQEELDRVLGLGQLPQPEHQRVLPYTNAVLHEVQRYITLLPHVPRCTAADVRLGGYLLPKVGPHLLPFDLGWIGDFLSLTFTCERLTPCGRGGRQELPQAVFCSLPPPLSRPVYPGIPLPYRAPL